MSNIFEISKEYLNLINEIENAEGEITEEVANQLAITEADFAQKMNAYQRVIKSKEALIAAHKDEKARLDKNIKSMENTITRLKKVMTDALILMGDTGKSGNKTLKTDLYNFFTVDTTSVEVDPTVFNLNEPKAVGFLKIKIPLVVNKSEAATLLSLLKAAVANDPEVFTPICDKIENVAFTVEPDKDKLKTFLEQQEEIIELRKKQSGQLPIPGNELPEPVVLPGVNLKVTTGIRSR